MENILQFERPALCAEGEWEELPAGPIFRLVNKLDGEALEKLLQQPHRRRQVNDPDGDGAGALHNLALSGAGYDDAKAIVEAFRAAGADLNMRNSQKETPLLMASCYGHYGTIRALVEAGAAVHNADWSGATAVSRCEKALEKPYTDKENCRKALDLLKKAARKEEESSPDAKRGEDLRVLGNTYYQNKDWEKAVEMYTQSLDLWEDYRTYGNRSAAHLKSACERALGGTPGHRNRFKWAFQDAAKAVGMDNTYEKGWYRQAKGYLGYRDLPRAKYFLKKGLEHCPLSVPLREMWEVLDSFPGIFDGVSNHMSDAHQELVHKLYVEHWIGPVSCDYCTLNCMDHPKPDDCPFCGCETSIKLSEEDQHILMELMLF